MIRFQRRLDSSEGEVSSGKGGLELAEKLESRNGSLLRQTVSQNDYDGTLRQLKSARSELEAAEAKARIAKEN